MIAPLVQKCRPQRASQDPAASACLDASLWFNTTRACFLQRDCRPEAREPAADNHDVRLLRSCMLIRCDRSSCSSARACEGQLYGGA